MNKLKSLFSCFITLIEKHFLILKKSYQKIFGPAHLRALNLIERNPGINLGELIFKLKVTKQSLNRVLRDLIKSKMIKQIQDETDTRKRIYFWIKRGKLFLKQFIIHKKKEFLML